MSQRGAQAEALPDPSLTYRYYALSPETRVGPQIQGLEFQQRMPWPGKRGSAAARESDLADGAAWHTRARARDLIARLKHEYFEAAYLQEALTINREESELLRRFEEIALTRYATGVGIQQSVIKVQTEISRMEDQRMSLRRRLDVARERILRLVGEPAAGHPLAPISLPSLELPGPSRPEMEEALERHPLVREALQQVAAGAEQVRNRGLEKRPDFTFGAAYTLVDRRQDTAGSLVPPEDNGQDILGLSVGLSLPLHRRRIRSGVAEAEALRQASASRVQDVRDDLLFLLRDAASRQAEMGERARLYAEVVVPQAEAALGSAEAAYATSEIDFLELLDSQRVLFEVRLTHHRLLSDYWSALADLEYGLARAYPATMEPAGDPVAHRSLP